MDSPGKYILPCQASTQRHTLTDMWVVTHVVAGLGMAAALHYAGAPWWVILVVMLVAHILMDLVPHWDYTVTGHVALLASLDGAASFAAFLLTWQALGWPFWLAFMGLVSGAPDLDVLIALLRRRDSGVLFPSHWRRFPHGRAGPLWGILVQAAFMVGGIVVALTLGP